MTEPDSVILGSSFGVLFEWTKPTEANPNVSEAVNPTAAEVQVVRARTGETVTLVDDTVTITTNQTTYIIPASSLNRVGNYSIYMTATFADGSTATRSRPFRVLAKDGLN